MAPGIDRTVCVIGLGYVGLTLAVALCEAGFRVHGVERNPAIVAAVESGRAHFVETGLDPILQRHVSDRRLTCTAAIPDEAAITAYVVTVGTPLTPGHKANLQALRTVAEDLLRVLKAGDLVVLRSTVRIGASRSQVQAVLDRAEVDYDLAYCPERTAEGKALEELRSLPQIVGGATPVAAERAGRLFAQLTTSILPVSSLETAELIKLVNNTQRDYLFAFANEVAEICDTVGLSAAEVLETAAIRYPRAVLARPGPVGGPCLEKDPHILAESAAAWGGAAPLALAARGYNEGLPARTTARIAAWFEARATAPKRIAIAGLAFKGRPATSDLRGSLVVPLIAELRSRFPEAGLCGYDPSVFGEDAATLGIEIVSDPAAAVKGSDLLIFQTNHPNFAALDWPALLPTLGPGALIYDFWNQFDLAEAAPRHGVQYAGLGDWPAAVTQVPAAPC